MVSRGGAPPGDEQQRRKTAGNHAECPLPGSGFLHEQSDEKKETGHEHQKENHVVDMISVLAAPALLQKIVDLLVGHVGLFPERHALVCDIVLVFVFDQKPMAVYEERIIKKINDKKKTEQIVQIVVKDHEQTGHLSRHVRPGCSVAISLCAMVVAPVRFGSINISSFYTEANPK
jgi:hypothetical protein